ncbi:MAG TPA: hypothetical protein VGO96_06700 [Pyrinomonadaceae bacterium]|nr:hypothetical protein [Pyrinomonadaceae bacterium]
MKVRQAVSLPYSRCENRCRAGRRGKVEEKEKAASIDACGLLFVLGGEALKHVLRESLAG